MEENMNKLNWPTAFVIVAFIFAGAFVYNKPIGAALGGRASRHGEESKWSWVQRMTEGGSEPRHGEGLGGGR